MHRKIAVGCVLAVWCIAAVGVESAGAQPNVTGQWSLLPQTMPINPIHVGLMRTGKILVVSGSQNDPTVMTNTAAVYDPSTGAIAVQTIPWDLFCNGLSWMPDGRALIAGGNLQYNPFRGIRTTTMFDPNTEKFIQVQDMARGRWYPSVVGLADGRMATFSGWLEGGGTNNAVEIYTNPNGWSPEFLAPFTPELYPWLHLLPDGRVFMSGANVSSSIFDPATTSWQSGVAATNYPRPRIYGSSVLLPLSAADNWRARVMIMGGDNPATETAEIIDLSQPGPRWRATASMSGPRIQMNAVILPTGKILALGGSSLDKTASTATLNADLFDPATETWTPGGTMNRPRLYHSVALLLPDGTVWAAGSNPSQGDWDNRMELYRPAYLFNASGGPAARPSITAAPAIIGYGGGFQISTPNAADIASVALIRAGANTHAFDMDQRMISLTFSKGAGTLNVSGPPNANIAPPGYYMLFILDSNGVPAVARFIQVASNPVNQPPRGAIDQPSGDVTIAAGASVTFAGSASDADGAVSAYRWIFPGGSPATSTSATPGAVTFNTPGTYYVSLTVSDNQGATDPSPPVRVITVQSSSLTASFTSPADGATVDGSITVGMSVSGGSGSSNTFTLTVDGTQVFSTSTSATSQSYTWDTTSVANGVHTLGLTVRDASGTVATASRSVTVNSPSEGTLQVTFPNITQGQIVQGSLPVQIAVSGAAGTSNRFTIFVDGAQQAAIVSNSTTVTWNWDTTTAANGSRTITASVQDATGNTGSGVIAVQVQNSGLQVFITQPTGGATVSGPAVWTTMWVNGAAAGSKTYTLSVGPQTLASGSDTSSGPVSIPWDSRQVANGPQTLTATVRDPSGKVGSTAIAVTVQNAGSALTAGFSAPAAGATVSGTVSVGMTASGGTAPYAYTLTIDGAQVASSGTSTYAWNTTGYSNASHTLALTVRDASGTIATATRSVTVQNGGAPPPPPPGSITVFVTQPASGATVTGTQWVVIWIERAAAGTKTFTLTAGGQTVATTNDSSNGPVSMPWITTGTPNGPTTLTASVRDASNNTGALSLPVTVQNGASALTAVFTTPAAGETVGGTVSVGMSGSGGTAPYTYTLTIDGAQVASGASNVYSWNTTTYSNAGHTLGLTVRDGAGATATATRTVTVQNGGAPPPPPPPPPPSGTLSVALTTPSSGSTVRGTVWVTTWVDGAAAGAKTYTLSIGGTTVWNETTADRPASLPWVTTNGTNGTRTLVVTVGDSAGATGTGSVTVTVSNP